MTVEYQRSGVDCNVRRDLLSRRRSRRRFTRIPVLTLTLVVFFSPLLAREPLIIQNQSAQTTDLGSQFGPPDPLTEEFPIPGSQNLLTVAYFVRTTKGKLIVYTDMIACMPDTTMYMLSPSAQFGDTGLTADMLVFDTKHFTLRARGNVTIEQGGKSRSAAKANLNLKRGTLVIKPKR